MHVKVRKWGNSASVRIPSVVMDAAKLHLDATVDVHVEDGRVVIEPVQADDLASLIAGITPENLHEEADFGPAEGEETL